MLTKKNYIFLFAIFCVNIITGCSSKTEKEYLDDAIYDAWKSSISFSSSLPECSNELLIEQWTNCYGEYSIESESKRVDFTRHTNIGEFKDGKVFGKASGLSFGDNLDNITYWVTDNYENGLTYLYALTKNKISEFIRNKKISLSAGGMEYECQFIESRSNFEMRYEERKCSDHSTKVEWSNKLRHGKAVMVYKNGVSLEFSYVENKIKGPGKIIDKDGREIFKGNFSSSDEVSWGSIDFYKHIESGSGKIPNTIVGFEFTGSVSEDGWVGKVDRGECKMDGKFILLNNKTSLQLFQGKIFCDDGSMQQGEFDLRSRQLIGKGVSIDTKGIKYVGNFEQGLLTGKGESINPDGTKYIGTFEKGVATGEVKIIYADGRTKTTTFFKGKEIGWDMMPDSQLRITNAIKKTNDSISSSDNSAKRKQAWIDVNRRLCSQSPLSYGGKFYDWVGYVNEINMRDNGEVSLEIQINNISNKIYDYELSPRFKNIALNLRENTWSKKGSFVKFDGYLKKGKESENECLDKVSWNNSPELYRKTFRFEITDLDVLD